MSLKYFRNFKQKGSIWIKKKSKKMFSAAPLQQKKMVSTAPPRLNFNTTRKLYFPYMSFNFFGTCNKMAVFGIRKIANKGMSKKNRKSNINLPSQQVYIQAIVWKFKSIYFTPFSKKDLKKDNKCTLYLINIIQKSE